MIALLAALAIQSAFQQEAPALLEQSTTRIIDSYGDMAEALGQCAHVYPGGASHPYVRKARSDVAELGIEPLSVEVERVESILYAREAAKPADRSLTVEVCAERIEEPAEMVSTHVEGLRGLLSALARDR